MTEHAHRFDAAEWPFAVPPDTEVFVSVRVLHQGLPIVVVHLDDSGDWHFGCGSTLDEYHGTSIHLCCLFDADTSLAAIADLPRGWTAWRMDAAQAWARGELEPEDEPIPRPFRPWVRF
jgi:hypothetical protein